jgi:queuine/archaeosine tRNA-ribosyltransferase
VRTEAIQDALYVDQDGYKQMKFFFPDSQDLVDPSFDFESETRYEHRVRQRDDQYAHEVFEQKPYDGILVSKAIVDGIAGSAGKYTLAQRHRLMRLGCREFFRLPAGSDFQTIGDCGAFSYVREERPPYTVDEVIDFYENCDFDYGISVDHVIVEYDAKLDMMLGDSMVPQRLLDRQSVTLELAEEFLRRQKVRKSRFIPMGVAQGWSPDSYAYSVSALQRMGYRRIALGGMVPLKTQEIRDVVERVGSLRSPNTTFHLLGINRIEHVNEFASFGVSSFDSTSPLRRAFKDDKDNYFTFNGTYTAIRVPQVDAPTKLQRRITAGEIDQATASRLERMCLDALIRYDNDDIAIDDVLTALRSYELVHDGRVDRTEAYRRVLEDRPWRNCPCSICKKIGIHVMLFRGAERNRRRGFHNVYVVYEQLRNELSRATIGSTSVQKKKNAKLIRR